MTVEAPVNGKDRETLAAFQSALLELLGSELPPEALMHELQNNPTFLPYRDYVATFEPRMVEVAAQLTRKWGRREAGIPALNVSSDESGSRDTQSP